MPPVTMRDVAHQTGLSLFTVSKVLNGHPAVMPATRDKVLAACQALGYARNPHAVNLVRGKSKTIGLLVSQILNPFYGEIVEAAERTARELGYDLIYRCSYLDPVQEAEIVRQFIALRVCGLIITPVVTAENQALLQAVGRQLPVVFLDRFFDPESNYVITDNFASGRLMTEHLLGLGRVPHYLASSRSALNSALKDREAGYRAAMAAAGEEARFLPAGGEPSPRDDERFGYEAVAAYLRRYEAPSALFCANDLVALGALCALAESGVKVGEPTLVAGHDNISLSAYLSPPLTTMTAPKAEMGKRAIEAVIRLSQNPGAAIREVLQATLEVRGSSQILPQLAESGRTVP
jgi:DNA-binding LacI/PurR family transcriptional regulator